MGSNTELNVPPYEAGLWAFTLMLLVSVQTGEGSFRDQIKARHVVQSLSAEEPSTDPRRTPRWHSDGASVFLLILLWWWCEITVVPAVVTTIPVGTTTAAPKRLVA